MRRAGGQTYRQTYRDTLLAIPRNVIIYIYCCDVCGADRRIIPVAHGLAADETHSSRQTAVDAHARAAFHLPTRRPFDYVASIIQHLTATPRPGRRLQVLRPHGYYRVVVVVVVVVWPPLVPIVARAVRVRQQAFDDVQQFPLLLLLRRRRRQRIELVCGFLRIPRI